MFNAPEVVDTAVRDLNVSESRSCCIERELIARVVTQIVLLVFRNECLKLAMEHHVEVGDALQLYPPV